MKLLGINFLTHLDKRIKDNVFGFPIVNVEKINYVTFDDINKVISFSLEDRAKVEWHFDSNNNSVLREMRVQNAKLDLDEQFKYACNDVSAVLRILSSELDCMPY